MTFPHAAVDLIRDSGAEAVSVVYREAATGREWSIDDDRIYHAASTMKLAVMMEVWRQARLGRISLDDSIPVRNRFTSIADGSPYSVTPGEDSDPELHALVDTDMRVRDLVRRMIVRSGNLATNVLIDLVSACSVQEFVNKLGAPEVVVRRGVEDNAAFAAGLNNTASARGLGHLLTKLARREVVTPRDSDAMLDVMLDQEFGEGIPAGLPAGTPVAHKTGWNSLAYHDAAVIDPHGPNPIVFVVLTTGFTDMEHGGAFVADLTRAMFR